MGRRIHAGRFVGRRTLHGGRRSARSGGPAVPVRVGAELLSARTPRRGTAVRIAGVAARPQSVAGAACARSARAGSVTWDRAVDPAAGPGCDRSRGHRRPSPCRRPHPQPCPSRRPSSPSLSPPLLSSSLLYSCRRPASSCHARAMSGTLSIPNLRGIRVD